MKTYRQGDTIRRIIKLAYKGTGEPVNLTGCQAYSEMRTQPGGELKAVGTIIIDAALGLISAAYTPAQTAVLAPGKYGYDIRIRSEGDALTLYTEEFMIKKAYTEME